MPSSKRCAATPPFPSSRACCAPAVVPPPAAPARSEPESAPAHAALLLSADPDPSARARNPRRNPPSSRYSYSSPAPAGSHTTPWSRRSRSHPRCYAPIRNPGKKTHSPWRSSHPKALSPRVAPSAGPAAYSLPPPRPSCVHIQQGSLPCTLRPTAHPPPQSAFRILAIDSPSTEFHPPQTASGTPTRADAAPHSPRKASPAPRRSGRPAPAPATTPRALRSAASQSDLPHRPYHAPAKSALHSRSPTPANPPAAS